jgi:hypothetical protein
LILHNFQSGERVLCRCKRHKAKGLQTKHELKAVRYERKQVENCSNKNTIKDYKTNQAFKEHKKIQRRIQEKTGRKRNHSKLSRQNKQLEKENSHL